MAKTYALRVVTWTAALSSVFVMTVGAVLVALIVGDWLYGHTDNVAVSWTVAFFVMLGFLITLGGGVGTLLWFRESSGPLSEQRTKQELADRILEQIESRSKD